MRVAADDMGLAADIRTRIEALARDAIPRVVERVADEMAIGTDLLALDRVDLDLGRVRADALERDIPAAVERELREALLRAWEAARTTPTPDARLVDAMASRLGRLGNYLATGLLSENPLRTPRDLLMTVLRESPAALIGLLRDAPQGGPTIDRLVLLLDAKRLADLLDLLAPADAATILALLADTVLAHRLVPDPPFSLGMLALERLLWVTTIDFLLHDAGSQFNRRRYLDRLLRREAGRLGIDHADLLATLAAGLARTTRHSGFRSSFPVVLAALIAEATPASDPPPTTLSDPWASDPWECARAGDFVPLAEHVRRADTDPLLRAIVGRLDRALFVGLVGEIEPVGAQSIVALTDELQAIDPIAALPVPRLLAPTLYLLTLQFLLHDPGTGFNRRRYLAYLIRHEAARMGLAPATLLDALAIALERSRVRSGRTASLAATLEELVAYPGGMVSASAIDAIESYYTRFASTAGAHDRDSDHQALRRVLLRTHPALAQQPEILAAVTDAPAAALRMLAYRGLSSAMQPVAIDRWDAGVIISAIATDQLPAIFEELDDRARRALLDAIDPVNAAAVAAAVAALVRGHAQRPLVKLDGARFAAAAWAIGVAYLAALRGARFDVDALADRLASGLMLASHDADPGTGADGDSDRVGLVIAGVRADRLAMVSIWLDRGALPSWAPTGITPRSLLGSLGSLSATELRGLFVRRGGATVTTRLARALAAIDRADGERRLARLLHSGGDRSVTARLQAAVRQRIDRQAARAPGAVARSPSIITIDDAGRLLAWLDGATESASIGTALARLLATRLDARDGAIFAYLARHRHDVVRHRRWSAILPFEIVVRVIHYLHPAGAGGLVEAARLLMAACRPRGDVVATLIGLAAARAALPAAVAVLAESMPDAAAAIAIAARRAQHGGAAALAAALRRALPPRERIARPVDVPPPEHPIYIANAGLVLLAPYLPTLFDRLGVLTIGDDGVPRIAGIEDRSRGVHLLQYLVDDSVDTIEPRLVFNKLLCGIAIAEPVAPAIVPSKDDLAICDGLLAAAIANWPILGETSVAVLRETFLHREGKLVFRDDAWTLTVQRKGLIDHLVDHVPWSFSTIYHRWMRQPIHVTW